MSMDEKRGWFGRHKLLTVLLALIVLVVVLLVCAELFLGSLVKVGIARIGTQMAGCSISAGEIRISPMRGKVFLQDLNVGNPEGFKTERAVHVKEIHVSFSPLSLLKKQIVVHEILVSEPDITFEMGMPSNIGRILENLQGEEEKDAGTGATPQAVAPPPSAEGAADVLKGADGPKNTDVSKGADAQEGADAPVKEATVAQEETESGKTVLIEHVRISDGTIRLSATFLGGKALPIPLPTIHLKDIGKEKETDGSHAFGEVLQKTLQGVSDAVVDNASNVKDGIVDGLKKLFK